MLVAPICRPRRSSSALLVVRLRRRVAATDDVVMRGARAVRRPGRRRAPPPALRRALRRRPPGAAAERGALRLAFDNAPIGMAEFTEGRGRLSRSPGSTAPPGRCSASTSSAPSTSPIDRVLTVVHGEPLGEADDRACSRTTVVACAWRCRSSAPTAASFGGWSRPPRCSTSAAAPGILCQIVDITQSKAEERGARPSAPSTTRSPGCPTG